MNVIDQIMQLEPARWIAAKIGDLPERARYRAASAIRSLHWASKNYDADMSIPASYFALHATEEAVAAFVSCAKEYGYGDDAKLNLKDHRAKATVSLLAQKTSNLLVRYEIGLALEPDSDMLIARYTVNGLQQYREASTSLFHFTDGQDGPRKSDFLDELVSVFGDIETLKLAVSDGQNARNTILYATSDGMPTGFLDPEASLHRECQLTFGLIWAAVDISRNPAGSITFIRQALRTANLVTAELKSK